MNNFYQQYRSIQPWLQAEEKEVKKAEPQQNLLLVEWRQVPGTCCAHAGLPLDYRLQGRAAGCQAGQAEGPLLRVQMPHHHELHEDLPQGPQPWKGYRRDQEAVGRHRRQGRAWSEGRCRSDPSSRVTTFRLSPLEQT